MKSDSRQRNKIEKGTVWFQRFVREAQALSPHLVFKRIKYGFYRIYWLNGGQPAYIGECYKEMPEYGFDLEDIDAQLQDKKYFEEYEDKASLTRKIKNFVEGYRDSIERLRTKVYMLKNNKEFREQATKAYQQVVVK